MTSIWADARRQSPSRRALLLQVSSRRSLAARVGVQSGVQFERNGKQLRTTQSRGAEPKRAQKYQNLPAGGRAVAGSNPVSPIVTKGPQTRAFSFRDTA